MNTNDTLERMVTDRLASDAAGYGSDRALDDALAVTSRMRPYPQWLALMKEPPMRIPSRVVVGSPTFRLAAILALTLALALALAGAVAGAASLLPREPVPAPFGPARNGPLAYPRDGDIHLVDTDGTNDRVIIAGPEVDADPWFSYLGDRLFFVRNREAAPQIWMARPDGSDPRMLLEHDVTLFEHLPGRDQIVVRSTESTTISIVDLATGGVVTEVDLGGPEPTGWIMARPPDGHELILVAHPAPGAPAFALYGYDLDTGGVRQIGAPAIDNSGLAPSDGLRCTLCDLRISPDGTTVAYWSREIQPAFSPGDDWYPHARDLDTGEDVALPLGDMRAGVVFTFAPDGATFGLRWDDFGQQRMVVGPLDGSASATVLGLPFDAGVDGGFDFSPDGAKLYHTTRTPAETRLYDLAGGPDVVLPGVTQLPTWQRLAP